MEPRWLARGILPPVESASLILLLAAFAIAAMLTWVARSVGRRGALHDSPGAAGHVKAEVHAIPNVGGVAIFWTIAVLMGGGVALANLAGDDLVRRLAPAAVEHLPGLRTQTPMALALLACMLVLHVVGLIDDRRALPWGPKLLAMVGCAVVMGAVFNVRLLTLLDAWPGGWWVSMLVTVLWFVAITNAMNFMDNTDGLSGGVGLVAGALFFVGALNHEQWFVAGVLAVLCGALAGFLVFNFPWPWARAGRASIFMGDSGSLVVGFLLAFLTVRATYVDTKHPAATWYAVFMPLCVLAVPLYDLVSVCIIRMAQGKSPLVGDQQHFSHRLRARGLSVRQTLAVIYGCAALTGISGIALAAVDGWRAALLGVQTVLALVLLGVFEHGSGAAKDLTGKGH